MRLITIISIFVVLLVLISGCKTSSDPTSEDTPLTQEQATQIYEAQKPVIAAFAHYMVSQSTTAAEGELESIPSGFGNNIMVKPAPMFKPTDADTFVYNGNGCWSLDVTMTYEGYALDLAFGVCFDNFDLYGRPTALTDAVDISLDLDVATSYSGEGWSSTYHLIESEVLGLDGVADFKTESGNLTINGTHDIDFSFNYVSTEQSSAADIVYKFGTADVVIAPDNFYPLSGTFTFSITFTDKTPGSQQPSYKLSGSITFNGTSTVSVTFAGYKYQLNLADYYYYNS